MNHDVQQELELRRYLLGELPFEEQVLLEQRLFLDSDYAELHRAVEDELIDEYLADELISSERDKFVSHFLLQPEHGADLRIAQALKKYLATEKDPRPAPPPIITRQIVWLSLSVAALILLSIVAWIVFRSTRPPENTPQQAEAPQPSQSQPNDRQQPAPVSPDDNRGETAQQGNTNGSSENSNKPPERRSAHLVVHATIYANSSIRGGGSTQKVSIYNDTKSVVFHLPLEFSEPYDKYRAELLSGERKIEERSDLKSQPDNKFGSVIMELSANILREQSYRIKVYGVPNDQQSGEPPLIYPFNVERK